jgi:tRNA 2-thiocytidine biosynthesis protein TtcA
MKKGNSQITKKLEAKVKSAIYNYNLIDSDDTVMVGISGGKDSFALLDLLVSLKKSLPVKFNIEACHVRASDMPYKADEDFMVNYCQENNVPLHFKNITVDFDANGTKPACFICSWKRRKELFAIARERNCKKLAFGHHLDDAVETLLMNMIHHSSISSIPPKLSIFGGGMFIIRPLILVHDSDLVLYNEQKAFPHEISLCPHEDRTNREKVRALIREADKLNKSTRENIFRSMGNIHQEYIVSNVIKKQNPLF